MVKLNGVIKRRNTRAQIRGDRITTDPGEQKYVVRPDHMGASAFPAEADTSMFRLPLHVQFRKAHQH